MSEILAELENAIHKNKFWNTYRSFCENLYQEDIEIEYFMLLLPKILKQIEKDALSYQIYDAINKFAQYQPHKGIELLAKVFISKDEKILNIIPCTLIGLSKSNIKFDKIKEAKLLLDSDSEELKKQGYSFVVTFEEEELALNKNFSNHLYNLIKSDIDNNNLVFLNYIVKILGKFLNIIPEAKVNLIFLSTLDSPEVLYEIAVLLAYDLKYSDEPELFKTLLVNLKRVNPKYGGIINLLNHLVFQNSMKDSPELIVCFLSEWLLFDEKRVQHITKFRHTFEELHANNYSYFKTMLTIWFNSDYSVFHNAISKLLMKTTHYDINNIELDDNYISELNHLDIRFIVVKIIGYIYFKEQIRSLLLSILKTKINDQKCVEFIKAIFNQYMVFNYPSTIEFLEEQKKTCAVKVQKVIAEIVKLNKDYFEKINKLEFINEFNPSDKRLKIYNSTYQKEFQSKQNKVTENPNSFLSMCKNIQLRTGKGMFSKYEGKYTEKTEMALIQYSAELPRGEYIDAIGQEKIRAIYRTYKREI